MSDFAVSEPARTGATVGVEEEFHVVDPESMELRDSPELVALLAADDLGPRVHSELSTTQIETASRVCTSLDDVRRELRAGRSAAAAAAGQVGATVLAASTHPFSSWHEQRVTHTPRYLRLVERWAVLALQQDISGCHVHVHVPDLDTAVAVMDRVRPYLPVVQALTGSSPFHEGSDTGYDSFRTLWFARWPITGSTELLGDGKTYQDVVESLQVAGVIDDASNLYWDVRPSMRYPTLEFRVADVCTFLDDAVLHVALVRALSRVLAERASHGVPPHLVRPEVLRAARWRGARYGVSDQLFDPFAGVLRPAADLVGRLLAELRDDLTEHGEWDEVSSLCEQTLRRGTSAARQRDVLHSTADQHAVARMIVEEGLATG